MPKVVCTLENAADEISGIKFTALPDGAGKVSDEISEDAAASLLSIKGYEPFEAPAAPVPPAPTEKPATAPAKAPAAPTKKAQAAKKAAEAPAATQEPADLTADDGKQDEAGDDQSPAADKAGPDVSSEPGSGSEETF